MLIAIMGDSFNKVFENKHVHGIKMKIEFTTEYERLLEGKIQRKGADDNDPVSYHDYLFIGRQMEGSDDEDDDDEWEGTVRRLTRTMERTTNTVKKIVEDKCDKIQQSLDENNKKEAMQGRQLKAHIDSAMKKQSDEVKSVREQFKGSASRLEQKLEAQHAAMLKEI